MIRIARTTLLLAIALVTASLPADATSITYRVLNHPDGSAIDTGVDEDGYVLRLDGGGVQTFNGNHTGLYFSFDPLGTTARLHGTVSHNESGATGDYEGGDDRWRLEATFAVVTLTDDGTEPSDWYAPNASNATFDDMLAALHADANHPDPGAERSIDFETDVARIYFQMIDLTMTPSSVGPAYTGPTVWDEFPNDFADKQFFIQYRWRLWKSQFSGDEYDVLAAAGWLEPFEDGGNSAARRTSSSL